MKWIAARLATYRADTALPAIFPPPFLAELMTLIAVRLSLIQPSTLHSRALYVLVVAGELTVSCHVLFVPT